MSKGKLASKIAFCVLTAAGILFSEKFQLAGIGEQVGIFSVYVILVCFVFLGGDTFKFFR